MSITFQVIADTDDGMTVVWYWDDDVLTITAGRIEDMEKFIAEVME